MKLLQDLQNEKLIHPPSWLPHNTMYATIMGSYAYGVSTELSDIDVYGICIPTRNIVFPHTAGYIHDFEQPPVFGVWQEHHIKREDKEYDFQIYNIVNYIRLCMECNPNMVDSLYTPIQCVIHNTSIGNHIRENRSIFLSKLIYHKLKGYSYSQLSHIQNPSENVEKVWEFEKEHNIPHSTERREIEELDLDNDILQKYTQLYDDMIDAGKRNATTKIYGLDFKFSYHIVRLLNQCEQIFTTGDLDLQQNKAQLIAIRNGEWTKEDILKYFNNKEKYLEKLYNESTLRDKPAKDLCKKLLLECLEMHYGSLDKFIHETDRYETAIRQIQAIVGKI